MFVKHVLLVRCSMLWYIYHQVSVMLLCKQTRDLGLFDYFGALQCSGKLLHNGFVLLFCRWIVLQMSFTTFFFKHFTLTDH